VISNAGKLIRIGYNQVKAMELEAIGDENLVRVQRLIQESSELKPRRVRHFSGSWEQ